MRISRIISILLVLVIPLPIAAIQGPSHRESLRGIKNLRVLVADIDPEIEKDGLTKSQLQNRHGTHATQGRYPGKHFIRR